MRWSEEDNKWFRYVGFKGVVSLPKTLKGIGIAIYWFGREEAANGSE